MEGGGDKNEHRKSGKKDCETDWWYLPGDMANEEYSGKLQRAVMQTYFCVLVQYSLQLFCDGLR